MKLSITLLSIALLISAATIALSPGAVKANDGAIAATDHFAIDADAKIKVTGNVVKIKGRTLLLDVGGLQQEFHVMPKAKITRNLLKVELKAILPGDKAIITYVKSVAAKKKVAIVVQASAKQ